VTAWRLELDGVPVETHVVHVHPLPGQGHGVEYTCTYAGNVDILALGMGVTRRELERHGCDLNDYVLPDAYAAGYRYVRVHRAYGIAAPAPVIVAVEL
jgi:hypothetical protein